MLHSIEHIVQEYIEAWNSHDSDRIARLYAPWYEGIDIGYPGAYYGQEGARQMIARYLEAFPDLRFTAEKPIIQGSRAALSWTATGTHRGRLMHIPPTCHPIAVRGVTLLTIEDSKIARALCIWDVAGLLRDLRLLPELSA